MTALPFECEKVPAAESRARLRNTARPSVSLAGYESADTTHVTLADADGTVAAMGGGHADPVFVVGLDGRRKARR